VFSLNGKSTFITGGTAGIGRAVAERFVKAGARVAIAGRRAEGEAIAQAIGALFVRADCSREEQVKGALESAERTLGRLDVVVNNAGLENTGPTIEEQGSDELHRVFALNVDGVYYGLKYAPAHMNDGGSVINTSSDAALLGIPGYGQYAATKAAVNSLTKTAALELAPRRIRVNAVCPGSIRTEMLPPGHPEIAVVEVLCPLRRVGEVEDVVGIYHFLAADESVYVTGQAIAVDGGLSAGVGYGVLEKIAD
jgi:NAD(P)-dependent dehydrogenase (short-subunit alcohol dehydrogenase family)